MSYREARAEMDIGFPARSRATISRRVASARARKRRSRSASLRSGYATIWLHIRGRENGAQESAALSVYCIKISFPVSDDLLLIGRLLAACGGPGHHSCK